MATPIPLDRALGTDVTQQPLSNLDRYAGWLARGAAPNRVRASVQALGVAIAVEGDVAASVRTLEADLEKLGSGQIAGLLRRTLRDLRKTLELAAE